MTFHCQVKGNFIQPCLYTLLPKHRGKSKELYKKLLYVIIKEVCKHQQKPKRFYVDFDLSFINAVLEIFLEQGLDIQFVNSYSAALKPIQQKSTNQSLKDTFTLTQFSKNGFFVSQLWQSLSLRAYPRDGPINLRVQI